MAGGGWGGGVSLYSAHCVTSYSRMFSVAGGGEGGKGGHWLGVHLSVGHV